MISVKGILLIAVVKGIVSIPVNYDSIEALENPELFEGDILDFDYDADRNAVREAYRKWPNGRIPYIIDATLAAYKKNIRDAMDLIEKQTCITFVDKEDSDKVYLKIFQGQGCYSRVGKTLGEQPLSLGAGCKAHGTMTHELGHAIGFYHEHSRADRDDYVIIHHENIRDGFESEFRKLRPKEADLINNFDYDSIMLYGEYIFSKDHSKLKTMTAKQPGIVLDGPYDKPGLSKNDIERIKILYKCEA